MFEHEAELLSRLEIPDSSMLRLNSSPDNSTPEYLTLQWHITDRCNLKCTHCYIGETPLAELCLDNLSSILDKYISALKSLGIKGGIHLTGGEPLVRKDLFEFIDIISRHREYCYFGILSNGTLFDKGSIERLKKLGCRFVQVSIDGGRDIHDSIRGAGSFDRAVNSIKLLAKQKIPVSVSFTAGKNNYMEFPDAAGAAVKAGAEYIWTDRVIPLGEYYSSSINLMNDDEVEKYFRMISSCRRRFERRIFRRAYISQGRALQFMAFDGEGFDCSPYRCSAGYSSLTVLADGRIAPCRRMPVIIGDLKHDELTDIYRNSRLLRLLRNRMNIPEGCGDCAFSQVCNGGLKCLSYSVYGNPFIRDPHCTGRLSEIFREESDII